MNKERIALQEILDLCDNENKTHEAIWGIAYEALSTEVTEPIKQINNCDGCQSNAPLKDGYHLDKNGKVYMSCQKSRYQTNEWEEENGLIKQQSEKWKKLNADFDSAIGRASSKGYFDKLSLLPESSNPIATDHATIQPNQTEAKKVLENACPILFKPNTDVRKAILSAIEEYASLARKQVIKDVESWAKQSSNGISISLFDFKTYLRTLKK